MLIRKYYYWRNQRTRQKIDRKEFSEHTGIPVRTLEDWEAARRTPPEYIPRLIAYQLKYEELLKEQLGFEKIDQTENVMACEIQRHREYV